MAKAKRKPDADLTPAVNYIRMSSPQQEGSPKQQRAELPKLAAKFGCRIIREYLEPGISGDATDKRVVFQQMVRDAQEKGDFAVILCWDQDRFGRFDPIEAGKWIHPLREVGVRLITVAQGEIDWNTFAGRLVYMVAQEGKHQFLIDTSRNVMRGRIASAKKGGASSKPPYGFDRAVYDQTGKLVHRIPHGEKFTRPRGWKVVFVPSDNPEIIEAIRWIFDTYAHTDCSIQWLTLELNARKPPGMPAGGWTIKGVEYMLQNPAYVGTRRFGQRRTGKYHRVGDDGEIVAMSGKQAKGKAETPPIMVPGAHEGIVDPGSFDKVQRKLAGKRRSDTKPRHSGYILSGVLRCGHCGAAMTGEVGHYGDDKHATRYYRCRAKANEKPDCPSARVRQDQIEEYVLGYVRNVIFAPGAEETIRAAIIRRVKAKREFKSAAKSIQARIAALDKKIAKGTENLLLAGAEDIADMSRLLKEWRDERARLQEEIEAKASNPDGSTPEQMADRAVGELKKLQENYRSGDPMKLRAIVKALIAAIPVLFEPNGKRKRLARGCIIPVQSRGIIGSLSFRSPECMWGSSPGRCCGCCVCWRSRGGERWYSSPC
jgi:DNA invertase Pin-like site-specific DNA recombinase